MRYSFRDFLVPIMSIVGRVRITQANNTPSVTAAEPWIATQFKGPRFPGMLPAQHQGVLISAQTQLRGVLPLDYMAVMQNREDGLNLT
jgi:hypothetical protein